jgi:hypothetical protein
MRRLAAVLLLLVVALGGCTWKEWSLIPAGGGESYGDVYQRWTRRADVHKELALVLEAQATYRSPEFQEAFLRRWAKYYQVKDEELNRLLAEEKERSAKELRFVLVAQTGKREWNDFAKVDSIWRVFLENERGQRLPLTEKRQPKSRTETEGFFKLEPWSEPYELVFDLGERPDFQGDLVTLVVASVLGEAKFTWTMREH